MLCSDQPENGRKEENTTELVDPLGVRQKISEFTDKRDSLLRELDTRIKVSNATTSIRI